MLTRRSAVHLLLGTALAAAPGASSLANPRGQYRGRIRAEWLPNGREMQLLEPIEYIDPKGRRWPVPIGAVIDGASIPSVFWSIIGSPFTGAYRNASVIHDYYCDTRSRKAPDVHRVFYDAMLTDSVGDKQAWLMYQAVNRFGPQWKGPNIDPACEVVDEKFDFEKCALNSAKPDVQVPAITRGDLLAFAKSLEGEADGSDLQKLRAAIEARP